MEELTKNDLFYIKSSLIKRRDNLKKDSYVKNKEEIEKIRCLIDKIEKEINYEKENRK